MKLQNLTVIFLIIIIPIILMLSYYIGLQIDTITLQTTYNAKLIDSTREAIDAFEINTVEWNDKYSGNLDSKRRDIQASINTFSASLANNLKISGTSKNSMMSFVPAIAYTLYDGYYIYSATEVAKVSEENNGVARIDPNGNVLYELRTDPTQTTKNRNEAASTYEHILKPFVPYSERIDDPSGIADIVVNYTLDNYISIYGTVGTNYINKSGYLVYFNSATKINKNNIKLAGGTIGIEYNGTVIEPEDLSEQITYRETPTGPYRQRRNIPIYI